MQSLQLITQANTSNGIKIPTLLEKVARKSWGMMLYCTCDNAPFNKLLKRIDDVSGNYSYLHLTAEIIGSHKSKMASLFVRKTVSAAALQSVLRTSFNFNVTRSASVSVNKLSSDSAVSSTGSQLETIKEKPVGQA